MEILGEHNLEECVKIMLLLNIIPLYINDISLFVLFAFKKK